MQEFILEAEYKVTHVVRVFADSEESAKTIAAEVAADFEANSGPGADRGYNWTTEQLEVIGDVDALIDFTAIQVGEDDHQVLLTDAELAAEDKYLGVVWSCTVCGHVADHRGKPCAEGCGYCLRKALLEAGAEPGLEAGDADPSKGPGHGGFEDHWDASHVV